MSERYSVDDLIYLMSRLRSPEGGCPWDLEQDFKSITPSTIEEVYEVVDAIEREDWAHLPEELGDLLFQIIFYSQLAREQELFEFSDIVHMLTDKLVRRHPHVFKTGSLRDDGDAADIEVNQVLHNWEKIKEDERKVKGQIGVIDDVPLALPALQRAQKLQKRVAKAGMDWRSVDAVFAKLDEEVAELKQAIATQAKTEIQDELGDVLFCCVNLARHLGLDADHSLRSSNHKFADRIRAMESILKQEKRSWSECDDDKLEQLWAQAKTLVASNE
jgi:ATP diphosphatase